MKQFAAVVLVGLALSGCCCGPTMDCCDFAQVYIGEPVEELIAEAGEPYGIYECEDGTLEYRYIARDQVTVDYARQQHFSIYVRDDRVVATDCEQQEYHEIFFEDQPR